MIALGGCSGSDATTDPTTTATPTTGPTSPTSPPTTTGPTEPVLPAAARKPGRSGAEAFVRYYIRLLNYAAATGDTSRFREVTRGCSGCDSYANLFGQTYAAGGSFRGVHWTTTTTFAAPEAHIIAVLTQVKASRMVYTPRQGAKPRRNPADHYSLKFRLDRRTRSWDVVSFEDAS
ncbi:MAG: DUF6318 family protein [Nocardioidaceae bacterium]